MRFYHKFFFRLEYAEKNGIECLHEIKSNKKFDDIAIAIYSTSSSEEHIEETFVSGANIYIKNQMILIHLKSFIRCSGY